MDSFKELGRWPLLLGAFLCLLLSAYMFRQIEDPGEGQRSAAIVLVLFAAFLLGGFLVDWGSRKHDDKHPAVREKED
jgi:hypothetical protein